MSCGCLKLDDKTREIVELFERGNEKQQAKMMCGIIAISNGISEEMQALEAYINGDKGAIQQIFDKYMPEVTELFARCGK